MTAPAAEKSLWRLAVLGTLLGFASISTDLYLPALPRMAEALGAGQGTLELTVSGYLLGFSLGQLLWGPVGDRYGRRGPVAAGIAIFVLGASGCALSTTAGELIVWRLVQALGASAGVVLARAMVRDLYGRDRAAQVLSTLMTVMAVAPLVGPTLGGQILRVADWPAIFWTLVAVGLATLAALPTLPETLPASRRTDAPLGRALAAYGQLLGNRRLMAYSAAAGCYFVGVFAYVAGTPFAFIDYHGLSPQLYGLVFATGIVGLMATNLVNSRLVLRLGGDRLLKAGGLGAAASGILVALAAGTGLGGIWGLAAALFLFVSMNGFIVANAVSGALASVPAHVGAASALTGAIQYGSGFLGSALVGASADGTPWPLGWVVALSGLGALASAFWATRPPGGAMS
jgi:DHA1 family bicyclomycin/chloramphenicol resistance-like MFS transporter